MYFGAVHAHERKIECAGAVHARGVRLTGTRRADRPARALRRLVIHHPWTCSRSVDLTEVRSGAAAANLTATHLSKIRGNGQLGAWL